MLTPLFWEIHSGLEREGPGDEASLVRALALMPDLPPGLSILDVGCGPGAQTLGLLRRTDGKVTAVDRHQPYLDDLAARAAVAGVTGRVTPMNASMDALPFPDSSFDLIWCEGAIYFVGLREGLRSWRRLLKPHGFFAVTEPCWLRPRDQLPQGALDAWEEYPALATIEELLPAGPDCGYDLLGHFVLPPAAWEAYYGPIQARIDALRAKYSGDPGRLSELEGHQGEIDAYRAFGDCFSYLFLVLQRTD
jgi:SAM-dependent methyltransferase